MEHVGRSTGLPPRALQTASIAVATAAVLTMAVLTQATGADRDLNGNVTAVIADKTTPNPAQPGVSSAASVAPRLKAPAFAGGGWPGPGPFHGGGWPGH